MQQKVTHGVILSNATIRRSSIESSTRKQDSNGGDIMNKLSFVVAFVSLVALSSAFAAGQGHEQSNEPYSSNDDDDGTAFLLGEEQPPTSEKGQFAAMESGKETPTEKEADKVLNEDPEETILMPNTQY
jgi:hypothetical protein